MKRKDLLLLTFLLSQTAPVWAMDALQDQDDLHRQPLISAKSLLKKNQPSILQVNQLKEELLKGAREVEQFPSELLSGKKVFLVGPSGAGKTTLFHLLKENTLYADEEGRLDTKERIKGQEIGHERTSQTDSPYFALSPNDMDNVVLGDFPGDGDTGGSKVNLKHRYIRKKLWSGEFIILATVEEKDLKGKPGKFLKLMNDLTKTIPVEELKGSLALVVTKQGEAWNFDSRRALKKMLEAHSQASTNVLAEDELTEDVRKLLLHLTDEANINTLIPYFPMQKAEGEYNAQEPRKNILASIRHLKPMVNPTVQMQLDPESTLLISQLAKDLNQEIQNSIKTILRPKIKQVCQQYTTAYGSDASLPGLEKALGTIKSALTLLEKGSAESLMKFSVSFDDFFNQKEDNGVKECVNVLMFLQTLQQDLPCSTKAWAHVLQPTLDDIHELIDILGNKLFGKITTFLETINLSVLECCKILPESENAEQDMETFSQKLQGLNTAMMALQSGAPEDKIAFVKILEKFSSHNNTGAIESFMETLGFLNTLKPLTYPLGDWLRPINISMNHLKSEIAKQQKILDFNKLLEEEAKLRTELKEEARKERMALEEKASKERAALEEAARKEREKATAQLKAQYEKAETHRLAREEEVRKERATLKEAARKKLAALEEKARLERKALQEETRLEREETLRRTEKQHEDHRANLQKQYEEYTLLQQQLVQQKEEAFISQKVETERIRKEEEALRMTLEQSQRLLFAEAEQRWATEREKQNNEMEEQRNALTATIEDQNLLHAALMKQLKENTDLVENLHQRHKQQQKQHAETICLLQEEMARKVRNLEIKAEADHQKHVAEIKQREQESAQQKGIIQKLEARVTTTEQVGALQLAEVTQETQRLTQRLAQVQQYADQEHQQLINFQNAARERLLKLPSNTGLSKQEYDLLPPNQRKIEDRERIIDGKKTMVPIFFKK